MLSVILIWNCLNLVYSQLEIFLREKLHLERDKAQQEADIKIRQSEVQVLQKEFDSLTATLNQLESQKKEAQKRLDDLDDKVRGFVSIPVDA